jgi:hypothetical protein
MKVSARSIGTEGEGEMSGLRRKLDRRQYRPIDPHLTGGDDQESTLHGSVGTMFEQLFRNTRNVSGSIAAGLIQKVTLPARTIAPSFVAPYTSPSVRTT